MISDRRENAEWLADLSAQGERQAQALADLRALLMKGLPIALSKWWSPRDPLFDPLAEHVAQEALLKVLEHLDSFQGRSRFITWAQKIAVRLALTELRRKRWQDLSLEALEQEGTGLESLSLMADQETGPERSLERLELTGLVQGLIEQELTDRQRQALIAVAVQGIPLSEVASRMGTNRNALYKLIHDARLRLRRGMARKGLSPEELLASFEGGKSQREGTV